MILHHVNVLGKSTSNMGLLYSIPAVEAIYQPEIDIFPKMKKSLFVAPHSHVNLKSHLYDDFH